MDRVYNYFWYHHMISPAHIKAVHRSIEDKDFESFLCHYKTLNALGLMQGHYDEETGRFEPLVYLPDTVSPYNIKTHKREEDINILVKENFMKITSDESICG